MENKGFADVEDGVNRVQKLTLLRGRWRAAIACPSAVACCSWPKMAETRLLLWDMAPVARKGFGEVRQLLS